MRHKSTFAAVAIALTIAPIVLAQPRPRAPTTRPQPRNRPKPKHDPKEEQRKREEEARREAERLEREARERAEAERVAAEQRAKEEKARSEKELFANEVEAYAAARQYYQDTRGERRKADDEIASRRAVASRGLIALPIFYYAPETDLGLGAFALYYRHLGPADETRPSQLRTSLSATTRKQVLFDFGPTLWLAKDSLYISTLFLLQYYPDIFFGYGNDTPASNLETWTERQISSDTTIQYRILGQVYAGLTYRIDHHDVLDKQPGGQLANGVVAGTTGGLVSGIGPTVTFDARDNTYSPSAGPYAGVFARYFDKLTGSDYRYLEVRGDLRHYVPIGNNVLAFQLVGNFMNGDIPFYMISRLGGGSNLRGITLGRFRDNQMIEGQAEFRFPIFGRWGGTTFIGAGEVAHKFSDFAPAKMHVGGGGGLRFAVVPSERINIRVDIAYSVGPLYYLDIGEAF